MIQQTFGHNNKREFRIKIITPLTVLILLGTYIFSGCLMDRWAEVDSGVYTPQVPDVPIEAIQSSYQLITDTGIESLLVDREH